jgi:hypothetical protein
MCQKWRGGFGEIDGVARGDWEWGIILFYGIGGYWDVLEMLDRRDLLEQIDQNPINRYPAKTCAAVRFNSGKVGETIA